MNYLRRQIALEITQYAVTTPVLFAFFFDMNFQTLRLFLVAEYAVSIVATIGWLTWVDGRSAPKKKVVRK